MSQYFYFLQKIPFFKFRIWIEYPHENFGIVIKAYVTADNQTQAEIDIGKVGSTQVTIMIAKHTGHPKKMLFKGRIN